MILIEIGREIKQLKIKYELLDRFAILSDPPDVASIMRVQDMQLNKRRKIPKIPTVSQPTVSAVALMAALEILRDSIDQPLTADKQEIAIAYKWLYCDIELKLYNVGYENLHQYLKS